MQETIFKSIVQNITTHFASEIEVRIELDKLPSELRPLFEKIEESNPSEAIMLMKRLLWLLKQGKTAHEEPIERILKRMDGVSIEDKLEDGDYSHLANLLKANSISKRQPWTILKKIEELEKSDLLLVAQGKSINVNKLKSNQI